MYKMHIRLAFFFCLLLPLIFAGCAAEDMGAEEDTPALEVMTTIYPLADIASELGGDQVEVNYLLPAGASPHTYEPTVEQAKMIDQADLFLYIGADLDNWALELTDAAGADLVTAGMADYVTAVEAAEYEHLHDNHEDHEHHENGHCCSNGHAHGDKDPHFWLDPLIVRDGFAPAIHEKLVSLAPEKEDYFEQNLDQYSGELTRLHEEIEDRVDDFSQRSFIAFHSAWQYFADRYGLEEVAVIAQFPGQEPSAGWVAELIELIEEEEIAAIFTEPQFAPDLADRIAEESGVSVKVIDPLGGEELEGRKTYLDLMRYNLSVFAEAMQ